MPDPVVLLTWLATRNDPYERVSSGGPFRHPEHLRVPGPTLALLTDAASPYVGRVTDVIILRQGGAEAAMHDKVYEDLALALSEQAPSVRLHPEIWRHDDPTDHGAIFEHLRTILPRLRRAFSGRELVIHLSAGTPAMHTVWVLLAETGFIEKPFTAVQSIRPEERRGRPAVVPLSLGVDTFFKRWQETRPASFGETDAGVRWDPRQFRAPRLRSVYDDARRIARLKVPVLILGERGTGKTTLASWIRFQSPFKLSKLDAAWPAVPCGQYTSETMRAELFGYVKGAFTGADNDREGLLARAHGDTLFLDEIGDISRDLQRLLIKVLEEGTYFPVGSVEPKKTDMRLLAATNISSEKLAERIDADLLDRIRAFTLTVPPLREVPEELEWLWPTVLEEAAKRARAPSRYAAMSPNHHERAIKGLRASALPGNVRDLFRVAFRFLAARADDDAPMTVHDALDYGLGALDGEASGEVEGSSLALFRALVEGKTLRAAMPADGQLDPEQAIKSFKTWFAENVAALAIQTGRRPDQITTVGERTLRNWRRKNGSETAE